ncbi:MAG: hypothetical protein HKN47_17200 [Pirellulaceae bacterium]|nr:hypothetical protein [Pirellulaceae bacterium]
MKTNIEKGAYLLYATAFLFLAFAILDGFTPRILPFHEKMLGLTHDELPPRIAAFSLFLLRIIGGCLFAIAVTLICLIRGPFKKGDVWGRNIIGILVLTSTISLSAVMLSHSVYSPWPAPLLGLAFTVVALYMSRKEFIVR